MLAISPLFSFLNRSLRPSLTKHPYSTHVDQYRGLCALLVLINHATVHEDLLLDHFKWPVFVGYFGSPYLSVLVFFCISGYVIGVTNDTPKLNIAKYLKKRAVRLYPIYLVSIGLCLFITWKVPAYVIIGNIFFLQNGESIPLFVNYSTWTLHYEALYYLLFIALFYLRPRIGILLAAMLVVCFLLNNNSNSTLNYIFFYTNYFYFWILGLIVGWNLFSNAPPKERFVPILSLLFLQLCCTHLGMGTMLLHITGIHSFDSFSGLFYLPFCLMVMCILTGKDNAFLRINKIICYLSPLCVFLFLGLHHRLFEDIRWPMCLIYWVLSLALYYEKRISALVLRALTHAGKISYAVYLLHVPVALFIKQTLFIADQRVELVVKYTLWLFITFGASILLEQYLQPKIKAFFFAGTVKTPVMVE